MNWVEKWVNTTIKWPNNRYAERWAMSLCIARRDVHVVRDPAEAVPYLIEMAERWPPAAGPLVEGHTELIYRYEGKMVGGIQN